MSEWDWTQMWKKPVFSLRFHALRSNKKVHTVQWPVFNSTRIFCHLTSPPLLSRIGKKVPILLLALFFALRGAICCLSTVWYINFRYMTYATRYWNFPRYAGITWRPENWRRCDKILPICARDRYVRRQEKIKAIFLL